MRRCMQAYCQSSVQSPLPSSWVFQPPPSRASVITKHEQRSARVCVCLESRSSFSTPRVLGASSRRGAEARNMLTCLTRAPLLGLSTLSTPCTPSNSVRMDATFAHDNPFTILGVDLVCGTSVTIYPIARHHVLCTFSDRHMLRPFAHRRTAQMTMCAPPSEIRREHCIRCGPFSCEHCRVPRRHCCMRGSLDPITRREAARIHAAPQSSMNRFGDFSDHSASMHAHPISDAYAGGASCGSRPTEHNLVRNVKASKTYTSYTDGNTYTHGRAYTNGQQHMSPMDNLRGGQHHYGGSGRPYHGGSGRQHRAGATGGGQRPRDPTGAQSGRV